MESPQFSAVHAHWPAWRATVGPVDYEGSRCSNEIRVNVHLTLSEGDGGLGVHPLSSPPFINVTVLITPSFI